MEIRNCPKIKKEKRGLVKANTRKQTTLANQKIRAKVGKELFFFSYI
uniref:Uncharacterized protein n=1 Tax=Anguilla anguilla TaxID=7936 RepID=A0A0E9QJE5_ANGAN